MTMRELTERAMAKSGLDILDTALRSLVASNVVQALRHATRHKLMPMARNRRGVQVWAVGDAVMARAFREQVETDAVESPR